jgi:outer membrane protein assembly factor BamB
MTSCGTTVQQAQSSQKTHVQKTPTHSSSSLLYYQTADALYGVNARDGKIAWSTSFDSFGTTVTYNQAIVSNGIVYAESTGSDGYYIYAFDAAHGTLRWKYRYGGDELQGEDGDSPSQLLVRQGMVYLVVGTSSGASVGPQYPQGHTEANPTSPTPSTLDKIDAITGHVLWQHHLSYRLNMPILVNDTLYGIASTTFHGSLEALKGNDGSLLWQHQLPQSDSSYYGLSFNNSMLYSMALHANSTLSLFAFSASSGQNIWQSESVQAGSASLPTITQNTLYFEADYHHVYAFDSRNGKPIWQQTLPMSIDNLLVSHNTGTLYLVTQNSPDPSPLTLHVLSGSSGQQRWTHSLSLHNDTFNQLGMSYNELYLVTTAPVQGPVNVSRYSSTTGSLLGTYTLPTNSAMSSVAGKITLNQ